MQHPLLTHHLRSIGKHSRRYACAVLAAASLVCTALAQQPPGTAWAEHRDPAGFTLGKPTAWQVSAPTTGEIVVSEPSGAAAALVRARVLPPRANLAQWLRSSYAATEPGLQGVQMLKVEVRGPQVVHAAFDYGGNGFHGRASVVAVQHGDMATLFVAAAARSEFEQRLPVLTRILSSLRFNAAAASTAAGAAQDTLQYTRWTEPAEGAYSADLPTGWRTEGGLRRSTWNVRLAFSSTSPDGSLHLFSGDATLPRIFIMPNATLTSLGHTQGQTTGPDGQMILAFARAEDLGAQLVRSRFNGQVSGTRPRPDLVEITRRNPLLQGGVASASAADVEFKLADGRVGVLTLSTFGTSSGNGSYAIGNWWADGVHGFIAPPARTAQAARALARLITSGRQNPGWASGEREHQSRMSQQYLAYAQWSADLQRQTLEQRWQSQQDIQAGRRDGLGGTVRLRDPSTGETFEATASDRYYFRVNGAQRPTVLGSDSDFKPVSNLELTRLLQIGTEVAR